MHLHSEKNNRLHFNVTPPTEKKKQSRTPHSETADHVKPKRKILQDAPELNFQKHDVVAAVTLSGNNFFFFLIGVMPFLRHKASINLNKLFTSFQCPIFIAPGCIECVDNLF